MDERAAQAGRRRGFCGCSSHRVVGDQRARADQVPRAGKDRSSARPAVRMPCAGTSWPASRCGRGFDTEEGADAFLAQWAADKEAAESTTCDYGPALNDPAAGA